MSDLKETNEALDSHTNSVKTEFIDTRIKVEFDPQDAIPELDYAQLQVAQNFFMHSCFTSDNQMRGGFVDKAERSHPQPKKKRRRPPMPTTRDFMCDVCDKAFKLKAVLKRHKEIHNKECQYECEFCKKCFKAKQNLQIHMHTHSKPRFRCDICDKYVKSKRNLIFHVERHAGKLYHCPDCKKTFKSQHESKHHLHGHTPRILTLVCDFCQKVFKKKGDMSNHLQLHYEPTHACKLCNRKFKMRCYLQRHMLVHADLKLHTCYECYKIFKSEASFNDHMSQHKREPPKLQSCYRIDSKTSLSENNYGSNECITDSVPRFKLEEQYIKQEIKQDWHTD